MTMSKVTATEITGLVVSGTGDNAGTWNEDVDLDSFVTVPSGATAVLLHVRNASVSARWSGARTPGKTTPILLADMQSTSDAQVIVPLGTGSTVDLYVENLSVDFTILGFFMGDWTWFDVDAAAIELPSSSGSMATVTAPADCPANAIIMMFHDGTSGSGFANTWRPTGETTVSGTMSGPGTLLKLDASRQVDVNTSSAFRILGYCTSGVTFQTWYPSGETGAADGTFYDSTTTSPGSEFAYVVTTGNTNTEGVVLRENGSSFPDSVQANNGWGNNQHARSWFVPLDVNGVYEWAVENGATGAPVTLAYITEPSASSEATVTPTTGELALVGQSALVNDFETIVLRGTLINEAGSPLADLSGLSCLVWYNTAPAGAPDESLSSLATNSNGSYSFALAVGGLTFGQQVYRVVYSQDPPIANNCRVHTPDYE